MKKVTEATGAKSKPIAYSYIRFSTTEQSKGDSLRRQLALSQKYADENGLYLDESLRMEDLGVSAFKGKNLEEGPLSIFIEGVKLGRVKKGSYLLVEAFDRISRQEVTTALGLFLELITKGITVVTLRDGMKYNKEILQDNPNALMVSIMYMVLAHEESKGKSVRIRAAKKNQRSQLDVKKFTAMCPFWLRLDKNRNKFIPIQERVKIIKEIYKQALRGNGSYTIARQLNEKKTPIWQGDGVNRKIARKWHQSYVTRILRNEAVIGKFTPHEMQDGKRVKARDCSTVKNYFPAIITEEQFNTVRQASKRNRSSPGRVGEKVRNLFPHILFCAETMAPVVFVNKDPYFYLRPDIVGSAKKFKSLKYQDFEMQVLRLLGDIRLSKIFEENRNVSDEENEFAKVQLEIDDIDEKIERLIEAIKEVGISPSIKASLKNEEASKEKLILRRGKLEEMLREKEEMTLLAQKSEEKFSNLVDMEDIQKRKLIKAELRRIIDKIIIRFDDVMPKGSKELIEAKELLRESLSAKLPRGMKLYDVKEDKKTKERIKKEMMEKYKGGIDSLESLLDNLENYSFASFQIIFKNGFSSRKALICNP